MVESVIYLVFLCVLSVHAVEELQNPTILPKINAVASQCAEAAGMTAEQIDNAIRDKDINQIRSCFFKCYLNHFDVIQEEGGKELVNVPALLIFVKIYIPEISFIDLLVLAAEAMICARDFEKCTRPDDKPDCFKTKELISCLAKRKILINAFWLATRS